MLLRTRRSTPSAAWNSIPSSFAETCTREARTSRVSL
jgi:hypothetical protein